MADETADVSNKEQLVICIRWVDECFVIHEDFIGMASFGKNNFRSNSSNTKEWLTENEFKHPARPCAVL